MTEQFAVEYFGYLLALVVCGLAYWKGDKPLRWSVAIFIAAWTLTPAISHRTAAGWDTPVAILDTNVALFLTWMSLRWRRVWLAVFAALTILVVVVRVVGYLDRAHISRYAYYVTNNVVVQFQLLTLAVAAWLTARSRADEGAVRS